MTPQQMLEQMIDAAWQDFAEISKEEEEDGYSDAMVSMDRTRAEGFAEGLATAYHLVYDREYLPQEIAGDE
jgi:hypothetical protein